MLGFASLLTLACNNSPDMTTPGADLATTSSVPPDMAFFSCCGKPGETGNDKGIGQYCMQTSECKPNLICSAGQSTQKTYFCTRTCTGTSDTTSCGPNAKCVQNGSMPVFGCVPQSCLDNMPAGCSL